MEHEKAVRAISNLMGEAMVRERTRADIELYSGFVDSMKFLHGEPRQLSEEEEAAWDKARALREKADKLELRAERLRAKADSLQPENMYPDSISAKIMANVTNLEPLPRGKGTTVNIPKFERLTAYTIKE